MIPALGTDQPLKWSETPITFSRADHPESTKGVGRLPIVITPTIRNVKVGRVLLDGGSRLNVLSPLIIEAMQIPKGDLRPSMLFFGISPGVSIPRGQVDLAITFGSPDNFRTEKVTFDVADFNLPYNAILGRPSLAKFMASTHYAYMVVKMPGPKGPIAVPIDLKGAMKCIELVHTVAVVADQPTHAPEQEFARTRTRILPRPSRWVIPWIPNRNSRSSPSSG